ncbi:MAG: alpha/beta hydrolase fold family protein [Modestobacter sp.]|jgi:pimeloyl-ACP methyl ester carboxylesterase|nr:alpha/beta hydrolase fold family protein [Modestobacter sp.]
MSTIHLDLLDCQVVYVGRKYRTRAIIAGEGETLLLMHGIGGHAEAYSRNMRRLAEHYRVVAIDFVWHGRSENPPFDGQSIPTYADQALDVLDDLGVESAYVEGESLGGWVGLWLALNHPERVKKLVLNTSAGVIYHEEATPAAVADAQAALRDRSLKVLDSPTEDNVRARLEWLMAAPDRVTDELVALRQALYRDADTNAALRQVFSHRFSETGVEQFHFREADLARVTVPTLVLWSDKNPGHGPEIGERLASLIPGAQYALIEDAAHWPQWEKPEEHDRLVLSFLGS